MRSTTLEGRKPVKRPEPKPEPKPESVPEVEQECCHESVFTVDGCGAFCRCCGETLA